MKEFGSITPLDALRDLGVMRLTSRIYDLKCQGIDLEKDMVADKNRWGEPVSYATYKLKEEKPKLWEFAQERYSVTYNEEAKTEFDYSKQQGRML